MTRVMDRVVGRGMKNPPVHGSDPWSDASWGENALNVTFETVETDVFEFSTEESSLQNDGNSPEDVEFSLFRGTGRMADRSRASPAMGPPVVQVALHELLAATYDDVSEEPNFQLEGTVHVRALSDLSRHPFCLVLHDLHGHLDVLEDRATVAKDVSQQIARNGLHQGDRVLRISLPSSATRKDVQVARYICNNHVRPVPLLVKSRVQSSESHSRVGFKIRANPTNPVPLQSICIMLAVPPHVNGRSGKLSRKGGMWDELKRTVSWTVPEMLPGQALEIQAQFETLEAPAGVVPKFPILVRCEFPALWSDLELKVDYHDSLSKPVQVQVEKSARVLHRKV